VYDTRYKLILKLLETVKQCDKTIDANCHNGGSSSPLKSGRVHVQTRNRQFGQSFSLCLQALCLQLIQLKDYRKCLDGAIDKLEDNVLYEIIPVASKGPMSIELNDTEDILFQCKEVFT